MTAQELPDAFEFKKWPEPTVAEPDIEDLEEEAEEQGSCPATDGCSVEPDGECPHGYPSWLVHMGLI